MESKKYLNREEAAGKDSLGFSYNSLEDMWNYELSSPQIRSKENWYKLGNSYWSSLEPSISSVLGGIEYIHEPDIQESRAFLEFLIEKYKVSTTSVLDCGAGIGRVTKFLLVDKFNTVDMLEQSQTFVDFARTFIGSDRVRNFYNVGAQDFEAAEKYDVIWIQWVLSQLTDEDLIAFLNKIKGNLNRGGLIIMKENIKSKGFIVHKDDFSVTRSEKMFKLVFRKCGLRLIEERNQVDWPKDLIRLKMFVCIPVE